MTVTESPQGSRLELAGEIDIAAAGKVLEAGLRLVDRLGRSEELEIDMSGVTFIDSSGLGALVATRNAAVERGAGVSLSGVQPRIRRVFEYAGLLDSFSMIAEGEPGPPQR